MAIEGDTHRTRGLRRKLVDGLRDAGIEDEDILEAMQAVPRHLFLDSAFLEKAYENKPFQIGHGQTISQPYTVAVQTALLEPRPGKKVLEIGTGSGYQASILSALGLRVYSIENIRSLHLRAHSLLDRLGYHSRLFHGDGSTGLPRHAPYDGILVTAAAPRAPEELKDQLREGGILVIPEGSKSLQQMASYRKVEANRWERRVHGSFTFVPLTGSRGWTG